MTYYLYLDDEREPKTNKEWVIVRSYEAFVEVIQQKGLPTLISFDHDLGEESLSGHECAKWLIEHSLDHDLPLEEVEIWVHSANPVGRDNINGIFDSFHNFKKRY